MKEKEGFRLQIFKRVLQKKGIEILDSASDEELLEILNSSVLANSTNLNAVKNTYFFSKFFLHGERERIRLSKDMEKLNSLYENISQSERTLFRFGVFNGFLSRNWRTEMFRYINLPIGNNKNLGGKKIIYSKKFQEIFYFVYNTVSKGEENGRFPRF